MTKAFLKISIRNSAIYLADTQQVASSKHLKESTLSMVANARKLGFAFSEPLLWAMNATTPTAQLEVFQTLKEVTGVDKNWTPLVKAWDTPTGETIVDHLVTYFANILGTKKGTSLPCGHLIPKNTFPLERYTGCPFCGTPFEFGEIDNYGQGSKLKTLNLWNTGHIEQYFTDLLASKTALDATQVESLKTLLDYLPLPAENKVGMKETLMLVVDALIEKDRAQEASVLFQTPTDILRYLWYKHTGFLQLIEPKVIKRRVEKNGKHYNFAEDTSAVATIQSVKDLKLSYKRSDCRRVAQWLNELPLEAAQACEIMHPKRNMWVRFIRALRLVEYSKKKGMERLASLLVAFHQEKYTVVAGQINHFKLRYDAEQTFGLLKKRPGLFSRSLFANMLWFGADTTLYHFAAIAEKVPMRLLLTLNMYAPYYFDKNNERTVKPLGGTNKKIAPNKYLELFEDTQLQAMQNKLEKMTLGVIKKRFEAVENDNQTIFIEDSLRRIPLAIGDRSETVQDIPSALMGTRFPLEGDTVRLFMQWGNGLPAQRLDMDLSCLVAYDNRVERCSYSQLTTTGCKHSGDILDIPNQVGTAEYINIDVSTLAKNGARYVSFTCNAYSNGSISPKLVVGWMDSKYPMKISKKSGVAYDPSCVQHQVRVTQGLTKGLVFGVLDVAKREILWLEMSFGGQIVQNLDINTVKALMTKLDSKLSIGQLLHLKAKAQNLAVVPTADEADEVYDIQWAMNTAAVTQLLMD